MTKHVLVLSLALLASLTASTPAWAGNTVSQFAISGSPTGYTNDYATATVTIQRDPPGSSGAVPVVLSHSGAGWGGYECEQGLQLPSSQGCYVPDGSVTTTIKFLGSCVAATSTQTITARVEYNPQDPGQSASMTVNPFVVSVSVPGVYAGGGNQTVAGAVSLHVPPKASLSASLTHPSLTTNPTGSVNKAPIDVPNCPSLIFFTNPGGNR